ncbi:MAG: choice-of-anchor D domain-containing protein, partial [Planctomycetota bacterium]
TTSVTLAAIRESGSFGTESLIIDNTLGSGTYNETLGASFANVSGVSVSGGPVTVAAGAAADTSMLVGLSGSTAGHHSGTVVVVFNSQAVNGSGLGTTQLPGLTKTITVQGDVYAVASTSFNTTSVTLAAIRESGSFGTEALAINNTLGSGTYNETLGASFANASGVSVSGGPVTVVAGAPANTGMAVGLSGSTAGHHSGTVDVVFNSQAVNGSGLGTAPLPTKTITVQGDVYRLAAASAASPAPVAFGNVFVGTTMTPQTLTIQNTAAADGYSEKLNGGFGEATGGVLTNGSFSGLAAKQYNSGLSVWISTIEAGSKNGIATINLISDGTETSGYGPMPLSTQEISVTGSVYDHASGSFGTSKTTTLLVPLGTWDLNSGTHTAPFSLYNLLSTAGYTAGLALTGITPDSDNSSELSSDLATFINLAADSHNDYIAQMLTSSMGVFSAKYTLHVTDAASGIGGTPRSEDLTLELTGTVTPEPATMSLIALGGLAVLFRRRRLR